MNKTEFIMSYILQLEEAREAYYQDKITEIKLYDCIREVIGIFKSTIPSIDESISWRSNMVVSDVNIIIGMLKLQIIENNEDTDDKGDEPIIFLSHKSQDKKYGDALRNFIIGLGLKNNQLVYTSHPLHKIPLDENIYEYLRKRINGRTFMIFLLSDAYLESPACMNEMGAAWMIQSDYTNIYVPSFSFGNPKYRECAIDSSKMGAVLNADDHCKVSMIEFKNKIQELFELENDEAMSQYLLDRFISEIKEG